MYFQKMQEKSSSNKNDSNKENKDPPPATVEGGTNNASTSSETSLPGGGQGGVDVGGTYMVRRSDNTWCQAEVIQKRINDTENQYEYYVHYENYNRYYLKVTFEVSSVIFYALKILGG